MRFGRVARTRTVLATATAVLVTGGVAVAGEALLPASGVGGFASRTAALAAIPVLFVIDRVFSAEEIARFRGALR